jgi:hypothetical protein
MRPSCCPGLSLLKVFRPPSVAVTKTPVPSVNMSSLTAATQQRNVLRRPPRAALHGTARVSSIRLRNLQSSTVHPTNQPQAHQGQQSFGVNMATNQRGQRGANTQAHIGPPQRWFSDLGISLSNSVITFFAFIVTIIYGVWTWIQTSIANQIARASGALGLVQYCEQYSDTEVSSFISNYY